MLSTAGDYQHIDMSRVGEYVTGNIYPVRKKAMDGTHRLLKYEDLLFLDEAQREREAALTLGSSAGGGDSPTKAEPPERSLSGTVFSNLTYYPKYRFFDRGRSSFFALKPLYGGAEGMPAKQLVPTTKDADIGTAFDVSGTLYGIPSKYDSGEDTDVFKAEERSLLLDQIERAFRHVGKDGTSSVTGGAFNLLVVPGSWDCTYLSTSTYTSYKKNEDGTFVEEPGETNTASEQFESSELRPVDRLFYGYDDGYRVGGHAVCYEPVSVQPRFIVPYIVSNYFVLKLRVTPDHAFNETVDDEFYLYRTSETSRKDPAYRGGCRRFASERVA